MKKKFRGKVISVIATVIGLLAGGYLFFHLTPEAWFWGSEEAVSKADMESGQNVVGRPAGEGFTELTGSDQLDGLMSGTDCVVVKPLSAVPTGVWRLKSWVSPYKRRRYRGRTVGAPVRKPDVVRSRLAAGIDYNQYYLLELADHSYVVAQIPEREARKLQKGDQITLPIAQWRSLSMTESLKTICGEYKANTTGQLYAFDDEWYKSHDLMFLIIRVAVAVVVLFGVAVPLILLGNKIFRVEE